MKSSADVSYRIGHLAGGMGRKEVPPAFYQCYLIVRTGGNEVRIPLQFIPMGEI